MVSPAPEAEDLLSCCKRLIEDGGLREKLIENALDTAKQLDWKVVIKSYYQKLYSHFLDN
jgi:hypothetical protein